MDVEEFDIPEEFGRRVSLQDKLSVSHTGLLSALELFERHNVRATFFITAYWAQHYPKLVRKLAEKHEVASHLYYHSEFELSHLESSRLILEDICEKPVYGFRMPRLRPVDYVKLKEAGYLYDASLNPTWLPGRYNHLDKSRTPFLQVDGIWIIPSSVSPMLRYPVFWLSVKNMPAFVTRHFSRTILKKDHLLSFYFHPWELSDLKGYGLPDYISAISGTKMYEKMDQFLGFLKEQGQFTTHKDWLLAFKEF